MWVREAVWGGGVVFELLFTNNYKYSETPGATGRLYDTGISFSSLEGLSSM